MAIVTSIVYKPQQTQAANGFARMPLENALLVAGYGIAGDRKGGHPKRQLNIMSAETLEELRHAGYNTEPGALGEQLVVCGLPVDDLPAGTVLKIGAQAQVEIVEPRDGCTRLERYQQGRITHLGMMARVIHDGEIAVGDPVVPLMEVTHVGVCDI